MPVNGWRNLNQRSLAAADSDVFSVKEHEALTGTSLVTCAGSHLFLSES
jgi:hypothetical protein